MTSVSKIFPKAIGKKTEDSDPPKPLILPQKKRVLSSPSNQSPIKKCQKLSDESAADETLIRETEAALKNLSGSWPGPRGSSYNRKQEESPAFENLFDEKKANVKLSPSSSSSSGSNENACSLKDVITLRDQHEEDDKSIERKSKETRTKRQIKAETQYEPPDFNELVDDSSNELEIDMSESASEKNDDEKKKDKTDIDDVKTGKKMPSNPKKLAISSIRK